MKHSLRAPHFQRRLRLGVIYILCAIVLIWALAPIYWVAVSSISTRRELYAQPYKIWFPSEPTFESYRTIFTQGAKFRDGSFSPTAHLMSAGLRNSLIISVASAAVVTLLATGAGYAFARMQFRGKNAIFLLIMLMLPLPIWVSLIALFFIMSRLELVDTLLGLVLIFVTLLLPLAVWMMTTFVRDIPGEIQDAARVDGADRWRILYSIVLPLARPGMGGGLPGRHAHHLEQFPHPADLQPQRRLAAADHRADALHRPVRSRLGRHVGRRCGDHAAALPDGALLPALPRARLDHGRGEVGATHRVARRNSSETVGATHRVARVLNLCGRHNMPPLQTFPL